MSENKMSRKEESACENDHATIVQTHFASPAVDIFETEDGLTLVADVPGMDSDSLAVTLEGDVLTIEARADADVGENFCLDFNVAGYRRQFQVPDSFCAEGATADTKDGVLTLTLPRAEKAKPKKIEVSVH